MSVKCFELSRVWSINCKRLYALLKDFNVDLPPDFGKMRAASDFEEMQLTFYGSLKCLKMCLQGENIFFYWILDAMTLRQTFWKVKRLEFSYNVADRTHLGERLTRELFFCVTDLFNSFVKHKKISFLLSSWSTRTKNCKNVGPANQSIVKIKIGN